MPVSRLETEQRSVYSTENSFDSFFFQCYYLFSCNRNQLNIDRCNTRVTYVNNLHFETVMLLNVVKYRPPVTNFAVDIVTKLKLGGSTSTAADGNSNFVN